MFNKGSEVWTRHPVVAHTYTLPRQAPRCSPSTLLTLALSPSQREGPDGKERCSTPQGPSGRGQGHGAQGWSNNQGPRAEVRVQRPGGSINRIAKDMEKWAFSHTIGKKKKMGSC